jgi:hypothetical protein
MRHFRLLSRATICALALFSFAARAQADVLFNAASDWKATYANTAAVAASTSATWGNANGPTAWSAGELSWNWTNQEAGNGATSTQIIPTYYLPSTGYETNQSTNEATYNYTVPFQAYTFNPGQTNQVAVGPTVVNQINYGKGPTGLGGGGTQSALKLPSGTTVGSGAYAPTTTSGYLQDIGKATGPASNTSVEGFSTTSYNPSGGKFTDGGVFYNYGAATTSTSLSALNFPSSSSTNTLQISENFGGPTFVAWTCPATQAGSATISFSASDQTNSSDGNPGFYVLTANALNPTGPPTVLFEATNYAGSSNSAMANNGNPTTMQGGYINDSALGGTINTSYDPNLGPSGAGDPTVGLQYTSTPFELYVTAGMTIYFVADPGHNENPTHSNHTFGTGTDSIALSAQVDVINPEPSSLVLFGIGAVVLAVVGRRRSRAGRIADCS